MDAITIKKLKDRIPPQVDLALEREARQADRWIARTRAFFAALFALAAIWSWREPTAEKYLHLALAGFWLLAFFFGRSRETIVRSARASIMIDLSIVNLGLLAFTIAGLFPARGTGLFLCYFPLLAVAVNRHRPMLLLQAGLYATAFYLVLSLLAGHMPWFRVAILIATAVIAAAATRKPKDLLLALGNSALQEGYEIGAAQREHELMRKFHEAFLPPAVIDHPVIWSSSKHGAGTERGGDYYHLFETARGPLVIVGDLGGSGTEAVRDLAQLHEQFVRLVHGEPDLARIVAEINRHLWKRYGGGRTFSCVLAMWEDEEMSYINAGHLPMIRLSKQERTQIPVTAPPLGAQMEADFVERTIPFLHRDLLMIYTDGLYAKLSSEREEGIGRIEALADQFSSGEINTLCHRVFDCAQPGFDEPKDDCTLVVIRRQPRALEETKAQAGLAS